MTADVYTLHSVGKIENVRETSFKTELARQDLEHAAKKRCMEAGVAFNRNAAAEVVSPRPKGTGNAPRKAMVLFHEPQGNEEAENSDTERFESVIATVEDDGMRQLLGHLWESNKKLLDSNADLKATVKDLLEENKRLSKDGNGQQAEALLEKVVNIAVQLLMLAAKKPRVGAPTKEIEVSPKIQSWARDKQVKPDLGSLSNTKQLRDEMNALADRCNAFTHPNREALLAEARDLVASGSLKPWLKSAERLACCVIKWADLLLNDAAHQ